MKKVVIGVIVIVLGCLVLAMLYHTIYRREMKTINSFEECAAAGYPVMMSYPGQCTTSDGRTFTQEIGDTTLYADEIIVENPQPNQAVTSPLTVSGQARGNWFFEGSFSGELFDANNNSLGTVILSATGEWMTVEFVPFTGELIFPKPVTSTGTLVIQNSNPSGEEGTQKTVTVPVTF